MEHTSTLWHCSRRLLHIQEAMKKRMCRFTHDGTLAKGLGHSCTAEATRCEGYTLLRNNSYRFTKPSLSMSQNKSSEHVDFRTSRTVVLSTVAKLSTAVIITGQNFYWVNRYSVIGKWLMQIYYAATRGRHERDVTGGHVWTDEDDSRNCCF